MTEVAATSNRKGKTFHDHDLTHVIFGCDTSINGEIALKPWILFGTTISLSELKAYGADEDVQRLLRELSALDDARILHVVRPRGGGHVVINMSARA